MFRENEALQSLGYGVASVAFLILAILLLTRFRRRLRGGLFAFAAMGTAVWAGVLCWAAYAKYLTSLHLFLLEMAHDAVWIAFLSALLAGANSTRYQLIARFGGIGMVIVLVAVGVYFEVSAPAYLDVPVLGGILILGSILTSLFGLVALEQIYRNAREGQKSGLKFLALGVGGIFVYDLVLYSNAIVVGQIGEVLWASRGAAIALCVPLLILAAKRSPEWSAGVFVSRRIVFYSSTLFGAGIYLTVIGFLGQYLTETGGDWGLLAQIVLTFAAILALLVFLVSDRTRRRFRVLIAKHFFENKYDYREEWLGLIRTLTSSKDAMPLKKRAIQALAQILDVQSGLLWLRQTDATEFSCVAGWNSVCTVSPIKAQNDLLRFLEKTAWIIEPGEVQSDSGKYADLSIDESALGLESVGYIVPLMQNDGLLGFVVLPRASSAGTLNFEDYDLLKTAGQQITSYLVQEIATEKLAEVRQFEAFNKLTAFLMHDLKNVIAQQVLLVDNAEKHKAKSEFVDDAVETIRGSVGRMRLIIDNLQQRSPDQVSQRVEIGKSIMLAVSQSESKEPLPRTQIGNRQLWVLADPDRLQMGIYHAIRNAQDATPADGCVDVTLTHDGERCRIDVIDNGAGMDEEFVRERLFKPFDSTKGTQGMGIGAHQLREMITALGGEVSVDTKLGAGTRISIYLPLAE